MSRAPKRRQFDIDSAALLELWREWDPLRVSDDGSADDYASHVPQILTLLRGGADEAALATHLADVLPDHFGIVPAGHREFSRRAVAWWRSREEARVTGGA